MTTSPPNSPSPTSTSSSLAFSSKQNWSLAEQLTLVNAVLRSGEQNWASVSRIMKSETSRPPDMFSTKNCALQYKCLLQDFESPKRKRGNVKMEDISSGESLLKKLRAKRILEIKSEIEKQRIEILKLEEDVELLKPDSTISEEKLNEIEKRVREENENETRENNTRGSFSLEDDDDEKEKEKEIDSSFPSKVLPILKVSSSTEEPNSNLSSETQSSPSSLLLLPKKENEEIPETSEVEKESTTHDIISHEKEKNEMETKEDKGVLEVFHVPVEIKLEENKSQEVNESESLEGIEETSGSEVPEPRVSRPTRGSYSSFKKDETEIKVEETIPKRLRRSKKNSELEESGERSKEDFEIENRRLSRIRDERPRRGSAASRSSSPSGSIADESEGDSSKKSKRKYISKYADSGVDSVPCSPASGEEEYIWRKMASSSLTEIASLGVEAFEFPEYPNNVVHKPLDLSTIKRNLESGIFKSVSEFQRDVSLLLLNLLMVNVSSSETYEQVVSVKSDVDLILSHLNPCKGSSKRKRTSSFLLLESGSKTNSLSNSFPSSSYSSTAPSSSTPTNLTPTSSTSSSTKRRKI